MEKEEKENGLKEGVSLLGSPTFIELPNGRFKCVETGHEMLARDIESYGKSKRCRLGLIESALLHKKSPLNLFKQHPDSKSKIICKLTGDTINKSEEHIWKHISGRRFLHKLEQKEVSKVTSEGMVEKSEKLPHKPSKLSKKAVKKNLKNEIIRNDTQEMKTADNGSDADNARDLEEPRFWIPSVGSRWDFDDGNDRWGSCSPSDEMDENVGEDEADENNSSDEAVEDKQDGDEAGKLTTRAKRVSISDEPSSTSRKKNKSDPTYNLNNI